MGRNEVIVSKKMAIMMIVISPTSPRRRSRKREEHRYVRRLIVHRHRVSLFFGRETIPGSHDRIHIHASFDDGVPTSSVSSSEGQPRTTLPRRRRRRRRRPRRRSPAGIDAPCQWTDAGETSTELVAPRTRKLRASLVPCVPDRRPPQLSQIDGKTEEMKIQRIFKDYV